MNDIKYILTNTDIISLLSALEKSILWGKGIDELVIAYSVKTEEINSVYKKIINIITNNDFVIYPEKENCLIVSKGELHALMSIANAASEYDCSNKLDNQVIIKKLDNLFGEDYIKLIKG